MKSIINGKRYNTETSTMVGSGGSNGNISRSDFSWWEADLYRTPRSGAFFLAGRGGPMTRWAKAIGNNGWSGGSGVIPLSREEALEWAEQHLDAERIEKAFADVLEDA